MLEGSQSQTRWVQWKQPGDWVRLPAAQHLCRQAGVTIHCTAFRAGLHLFGTAVNGPGEVSLNQYREVGFDPAMRIAAATCLHHTRPADLPLWRDRRGRTLRDEYTRTTPQCGLKCPNPGWSSAPKPRPRPETSRKPEEPHTRLLEMCVRGERVLQPKFAHNHKAREIGERNARLIVKAQP